VILPTKNIAPDRALLTIAGKVLSHCEDAVTVTGLWDRIRSECQERPISYAWFVLSVDLLFSMKLVDLDEHGLLRRGPESHANLA
jgi:hypothetical protein